MAIAYSYSDVYRSLLEQGYSPSRAEAMASAIGDVEEQSSNIVPNLAETAGYMAAAPAVARMIPQANKLAGFGRFALPGMAGNLAGLGVTALTGNNFYEKASGEQLAADLGGQIVGGMAGARLAKGLGQAMQARKVFNPKALGEKYVDTGIGKYLAKGALTDQQYKKILAATTKKGLTNGVEKKAMQAASNSAARILGNVATNAASKALAGRALGSALGSVVPGIGTAAGSIIGGYLLPKFFANEDEKMIDPDKGLSNSTVAGLGAAAALSSPMGTGARGLIKKGASKANEWMGDPVGKTANSDVGQWASGVLDKASRDMSQFTNPLTQHPLVANTRGSYALSRDIADRKVMDDVAQRSQDPTSWLSYEPIAATNSAVRQTSNRFGAMGDAIEDFGYQLGNLGRGTN